MATGQEKDSDTVVYVGALLREYFPFFKRKRGGGMHGYVNRTQKSGRRSHHASGRALDVYLHVSKRWERELADSLFALFIQHSGEFGVDHVIWNRQIWSEDKGGPRRYEQIETNGPHTDHIHIAFTAVGSQSKPVRLHDAIEELRKTLDRRHLTDWDRPVSEEPGTSPYD